ncbi:MAG: cytochrome c [Bacteroidetes bacterium]|nr:cytochrome c [Bacteroidota bacterium]MDA1120230.1 cytochrome c [Bacteroidota bacterium]
MRKQNKLLLSILFFNATVLLHCSPSDRRPEGSQRAEMRFDQYYVQGKRLYLTHCANCHGQEGEGLQQLNPPLAQSDYLLSNIEETVCIINKGLEGEIEVNGVKFSQPMPPHTDLRILEIAEIITYITNSWDASSGIFSARRVEQVYNNCK